MLIFVIGCVDTGNTPDDRVAAVEQAAMHFHCLNHTSIHVVTCSGSISLFPITITINSLRILSDNELTILSNDLNDVSILDDGILNHDKILDDVEAAVLTDFLDKFLVTVTGNDVDVCTLVGGLQVCR
jgi:hypothetical protein